MDRDPGGGSRPLEPKLIIPGHGKPQSDLSYVAKLKSLFATTLEQVEAAAREGLSEEEILETVTLEEQAELFAGKDPMAPLRLRNLFQTAGHQKRSREPVVRWRPASRRSSEPLPEATAFVNYQRLKRKRNRTGEEIRGWKTRKLTEMLFS